MMRLFTNLAVRLDRAMRHSPSRRAASSCSFSSSVGYSSLHLAGLNVRPGTLSWLIARAVTLQYR
jgi:hypothetical protein